MLVTFKFYISTLMCMISEELKFLSICYFHIHLTATSEVDEIYED